jgi:SAM-dependent methyltransferase
VLPHEYEIMHALELRHWWFRGRRQLLVNLLRRLACPDSGRLSILDYGCGTGGNTSAYGSFGNVVGVEPGSAAVRLGHKRGGARYCRASGTDLPFRDGSFDVVMASDVLEHIEHDDEAVSEIARMLRPGGSAILSVPAHQWLFSQHDTALQHFRRYSRVAVRDLLERNRLMVSRLSYWNMALFPVVCIQRLIGKRRRTGQPRSDTMLPPRLLNEALASLLAVEAALASRIALPWGVSLVAVAERR